MQQVVHQPAHGGGGDGKAQALHIGIGGAHLDDVDAHHLAVLVDERAAGVAGVQGGVGLDQRHGLSVHQYIPVDGGDDAVRQRSPQLHAQGIADGVHLVAHCQQVRVSERSGGQGRLRLHLQHRQIVFGVSGHVLRLIAVSGVQRDHAVPAALHHMVVRDEIAVLRKDDAGAHGNPVIPLQLHHDRHHGGIDQLINLLRRLGLAVLPLDHQLGPLSRGIRRDGDILCRLGGVVFLVIPLKIVPVLLDKQIPHHQSRRCQKRRARQAGQKNPQALSVLFPRRFRRCSGGDGNARQGADIGLHHLPGVRLPVYLHDLAGKAL